MMDGVKGRVWIVEACGEMLSLTDEEYDRLHHLAWDDPPEAERYALELLRAQTAP